MAIFPARLQKTWRVVFAISIGGALAFIAGCATTPSAHTSDVEQASLRIRRLPERLMLQEAEELLAQHEGDFLLRGVGSSMQPCYTPGTILVVHPTSFFMLRRGMPVVYLNRSGRQVAHVLVEESAAGWTAAGLNNAGADDEKVTAQNLVGIVRCAFVPASAHEPSKIEAKLALHPNRPIALLD